MRRRFQFSLGHIFALTAILAVAIELWLHDMRLGIWIYAAIMGAAIYNAVVETIAGE